MTSLDGLDFHALAELNALAWGTRLDHPQIEKRARKLKERLTALDPAGVAVMLARARSELVGFCWTHRDKDDPACWWVVGLAVHPHRRMHGVGRALVDGAIRHARTQGASAFRSQTHADNAASIAFHEHLGFASDGPFTAPDGDQLIAFRMDLGIPVQHNIRLWTYRKPCFSLLEGQLDHTRSIYYEKKGFPEAYDKLSRVLGTDQWICCYTVPNQRIKTPAHQDEVEWVLEIPSDAKVLRFYDMVVWERILGYDPLPFLEHKWEQESRQIRTNVSAQRESLKQRRNEYLTQKPPNGSWWNVLFVEERANWQTNAFVVGFPLKRDWVVKPEVVNGQGR